MEGNTTSRAQSPSILIFSRTEWLARSLESTLVPYGCVVARSDLWEEASARLEVVCPDVVIAESTPAGEPDARLFEALRLHAQREGSTPAILVTPGPLARYQRLAAMRAGAWEAFGFPLDPEELLLKVGILAGVRLEVGRAVERGLVDPLTGIYNARGLVRRAQEMVSEAQRHRRPLACLVLTASLANADELTAGESGAESLPEYVANALSAGGRESDAIGRLRGAEFGVLAPGTAGPGARRLADRLAAIVEAGVRSRGGPQVRVQTGCFAMEAGESPVQPVELIVNARRALREDPVLPLRVMARAG